MNMAQPAKRMRFPREVFDAVRAACRISSDDALGWAGRPAAGTGQTVHLRRKRAVAECIWRGNTPAQTIPVGPSYQVPLARGVKVATSMPVIAVGLITDYEQAEAIIGTGDADLVALARAVLYDPRWPWHAAAHFGDRVKAPNQYLRSQPRQHPHLFEFEA